MKESYKQYGYFDDEKREFVVTNPHTPTPWINYLSNGEMCTIMSQAGGGMTFLNSAATHRITRYRMGRSVPVDRPGHYVYIREEDGTIWTPTFDPCRTVLDSYKCRQGLGYTTFEAEYKGLKAYLTYFVHADKNVLIWDLKLQNMTDKPRSVKVFPYVEFSFLDAAEEVFSYHWSRMSMQYTYSDEAVHYYYAHVYYKHKRINVYMSGSRTPDGYDCDRDTFIGAYGNEDFPKMVREGSLSGSELPGGGNGAGALQFNVEIAPNSEERLQFYLGCEDKKEDVTPQIRALRNSDIDAEFAKIKEFYKKYTSSFQATLPDKDMERFVNTWTPYNFRQTFERARFVSAVHTGMGGGMQSRDSMQDALGIAHLKPEWAKERIETILKFQHPNGRMIDTFDPKSSVDPDDDPIGRGDNAVWSIYTTYAYLAETADLDFLNKEVNYFKGEPASIFEHLRMGLVHIVESAGVNGLPLLMGQDWNDSLNVFKQKGAESVMLAEQTVYALELFREICEATGKENVMAWCDENIERLAKAINSDAVWDGEWYKRVLFNNTEKDDMGSSKRPEAKFFLNSQSWAVISKVADKDRAKQVMDKADELLTTPYGFKLLTPPYTGIPLPPAPLTFNGPGISENAGVFNHANTWAIIARAVMGDGDKAYEYYRRTLPVNVIETVGMERYLNEPYCYSSHIITDPDPRAGMGLLSWLSGTCTWMYIAATEYILGIRATMLGLSVSPCIPKDWDGYSVTKIYRGVKYNINVKRGDEEGVYVNGAKISGSIIPIPQSNNDVDVLVCIAK